MSEEMGGPRSANRGRQTPLGNGDSVGLGTLVDELESTAGEQAAAGVAHVAYLPNDKVVGLSKLARVVETVARRPQIQEPMTEQIADCVMHELDARGVVVVVEATHTCMTTRGVCKPDSICTTSVVRGLFKHNPTSRAEVMALIGGTRR
jgi:GTP cyclohydrolase I